METNNKPVKETPFNVLITSRWDFGSLGCRPGLILQAKEQAESHNVAFHVIAGGLINERAIKLLAKQKLSDIKSEASKIMLEMKEIRLEVKKLKNKLKRLRNEELIEKTSTTISTKEDSLKDLQEELDEINERKSISKIMEMMIEPLAKDIDKALPVFYRSGKNEKKKPMKHYIVSSYAYDGEFGSTVIKRLVKLRRESGNHDIVYINGGDPTSTTHRIKLKNTNKTLAVVVPNVAVWRSKYYSTAPDRYLEDESKRTTHKHYDVYAFGCGSSSLNRRDGEKPFQRVTVPSLCKLEFARTSENMIGVKILKFVPGQKNVTSLTIQFKDLVSNERNFIKIPKTFSNIQKEIFEELKKNAKLSIGLLEEHLGVSRTTLERELKDPKMKKAGMEYDELSETYDFAQDIFLKQTYEWPKEGFKKDVIASFGCMHIASIHTHYPFITQEFPKLIAKNRVKTLLSLGDTIEGMEHNLNEVGEITLGMDYTTQEEFAAIVIADLMLSSLDLVLRDLISLKEVSVEGISKESVKALVNEHLVHFKYWVGNHDDWPLRRGVRPLITFDLKLQDNLFRNLNKVLIKNNLPELSMESCDDLMQERVVRMYKNEPGTLPSGTRIDGAHYYARRSMTSSSWPQAGLADLNRGQLVYCANFHVAEALEEWHWEMGLRSSIMLPTIKAGSRFESNMGKKTDFGAMIQAYWTHEGRGMMNETSYIGENPNISFDNNIGFKLMLEYAKVNTWIDTKKYLEDRLR